MATNNECGICCETVNKSTRKPVTCACGFTSCMTCCKTYLLGLASEPKCMSCSRGWTPEFIVNNMTRSFYIKELRQHMAGILLEREKSFLPLAQPEAEKRVKLQKLKLELECALAEYSQMSAILHDVKNEYLASLRSDSLGEKEKQNIKKEYYDYSHGLHEIQLKRAEAEYMIRFVRNGASDEKEERKKFMMHCRTPECRGFLSTQWKCELCEKYTCARCLESVGAHENKATHECKKENVESAEMIKKESKPCPACGVPIHRIEGCASMWCVSCRTGFNWNTLKIHSGRIDNPHYFEWRNAGGGEGGMPRNAGDLPCGGLPSSFPDELALEFWKLKILIDLIPTIAHISNEVLRRFEPIGEETMMKLRADYLLGVITEDRWKCRLATIQKTNSFRHCVSQVLEMYTTTMVSLYQNLAGASRKELKNRILSEQRAYQIVLLYAYATEELNKIKSVYNQVVPPLIRSALRKGLNAYYELKYRV